MFSERKDHKCLFALEQTQTGVLTGQYVCTRSETSAVAVASYARARYRPPLEHGSVLQRPAVSQ